jgi:hypothetical protein
MLDVLGHQIVEFSHREGTLALCFGAKDVVAAMAIVVRRAKD